MDTLLTLGLPVVGIAALIGLSWALGGVKSAELTVDDAARRLALDEPDFVPRRWLVSADHRTVLALGETSGEAALVATLGDRAFSRRFVLPVDVREDATGLALELKDAAEVPIRLTARSDAERTEWQCLLKGAKAKP